MSDLEEIIINSNIPHHQKDKLLNVINNTQEKEQVINDISKEVEKNPFAFINGDISQKCLKHNIKLVTYSIPTVTVEIDQTKYTFNKFQRTMTLETFIKHFPHIDKNILVPDKMLPYIIYLNSDKFKCKIIQDQINNFFNSFIIKN